MTNAYPEMTARHVSDCLASYFAGKYIWFPQVKDGPSFGRSGMRILDGVAVRKTWSPPEIAGVEIKVSRSDFLGDTKWPGYLGLCHRFYFAVPRGLVKKDEVDAKAGLIEVWPSGVARATRKAPFRHVELDPMMLLYLVLWRSEVTSMRDIVVAEMAADKAVGKQYACYVAKKLNDANRVVRDMAERLRDAEHMARSNCEKSAAWDRIAGPFAVLNRTVEDTIGLVKDVMRMAHLRSDVLDMSRRLGALSDAIEAVHGLDVCETRQE